LRYVAEVCKSPLYKRFSLLLFTCCCPCCVRARFKVRSGDVGLTKVDVGHRLLLCEEGYDGPVLSQTAHMKTYLEVPVKINEILRLMRYAIRLLNVKVSQAQLRLKQDLNRTILLFLEDLVAVRVLRSELVLNVVGHLCSLSLARGSESPV
jgi:hypothetical protein